MSTELIPASELPQSKYGTPDVFKDLATATSWLPQLRLYSFKSKAAGQQLIKANNFGLQSQKDVIEDVGARVDVLVLQWRPRAMRFSADGGAPLSYFNPDKDDFKEVQKLSEVQNSNCQFGPEFLVYVPSAGKFALLFMAGKTSRRQAPELLSLRGKAATLSSKFIETKQYNWQGIVVTPCSTPFERPSKEDIDEQLAKFCNPEDSSVEFVPTDDTEGRAR